MATDSASLTKEQILYLTVGFYTLSVTVLALRLLVAHSLASGFSDPALTKFSRLSKAWSSKSIRWDDMVMLIIFVRT